MIQTNFSNRNESREFDPLRRPFSFHDEKHFFLSLEENNEIRFDDLIHRLFEFRSSLKLKTSHSANFLEEKLSFDDISISERAKNVNIYCLKTNLVSSITNQRKTGNRTILIENFYAARVSNIGGPIETRVKRIKLIFFLSAQYFLTRFTDQSESE